jgi:hypothetical protein
MPGRVRDCSTRSIEIDEGVLPPQRLRATRADIHPPQVCSRLRAAASASNDAALISPSARLRSASAAAISKYPFGVCAAVIVGKGQLNLISAAAATNFRELGKREQTERPRYFSRHTTDCRNSGRLPACAGPTASLRR